MSWYEVSDLYLLAGIIVLAMLVGVVIGVSVAWCMIGIDRGCKKLRKRNGDLKP